MIAAVICVWAGGLQQLADLCVGRKSFGRFYSCWSDRDILDGYICLCIRLTVHSLLHRIKVLSCGGRQAVASHSVDVDEQRHLRHCDPRGYAADSGRVLGQGRRQPYSGVPCLTIFESSLDTSPQVSHSRRVLCVSLVTAAPSFCETIGTSCAYFLLTLTQPGVSPYTHTHTTHT